MAYKLLVLDADKNPIGEARSKESLQWREAYSSVGELKLVCSATGNNLKVIREGNFLYLSDRPDRLAHILSVKVDDNRERATMTVRARLTASRLSERVLMRTAEIGNAETGILAIVSDNLRGLPLTLVPSKGLPEAYDGQISWGSIQEAVEKIAQYSSLGFRVTVGENFAETFEVYKGKDRTNPDGADYVGFFSDSAGTLSDVSIGHDIADLRNYAIVAGEGEGAARVVVEVDKTAGGPRRELFVNASDLTSKYTTADGAEKTMTPEEYRAALTARGEEKLAETQKGVVFSATLRQSMLRYGRDYDLGDILPLRSDKYGIAVNVRLTEVTIIYEDAKRIDCKLEVVT